jgi:hypothetical protein
MPPLETEVGSSIPFGNYNTPKNYHRTNRKKNKKIAVLAFTIPKMIIFAAQKETNYRNN